MGRNLVELAKCFIIKFKFQIDTIFDFETTHLLYDPSRFPDLELRKNIIDLIQTTDFCCQKWMPYQL